jgi:hypothetical protein
LSENADSLDADIREAEQQQIELFEQQQRVIDEQRKVMAKIIRLRKQRKFLKERGIKMLEHDALLDPADAEPSAQTDVANSSLAATSEDLTLSQLLNLPDRDPFSPSFWNGVGSPAGDTVAQAGGSPSGSR